MSSSLRAELRYGLVTALGLAGCNIDTLTDDFFAKYGTHGSSTGSSGVDGGDTSGTGGSTGAAGSSTGGAADSTSAASDAQAASTEPGDDMTMDTGVATGVADSSETGAPATICGDGVVAGDEECDDGNADESDRCSGGCLEIRLVFSLSLGLGGDIGGLQSADAYCRSQALKAMMADPQSRITAPERFKALLPIAGQTIFDLHHAGAGPYQRIDGLRVADSFAQLFGEPLQHPISVDEFGQPQTNPVWTGMAPGGDSYPGIDFCGDWKTVFGSTSWGDPSAVDGSWLYADEAVDNPTESCIGDLSLYCIEEE